MARTPELGDRHAGPDSEIKIDFWSGGRRSSCSLRNGPLPPPPLFLSLF